jgi:Domain of unknown function (DUF5753)
VQALGPDGDLRSERREILLAECRRVYGCPRVAAADGGVPQRPGAPCGSAAVMFRAWRTDGDQDKIEQLVFARMDRQHTFDRLKLPSFRAVADQQVHLAGMRERASIKIQVIPAEAGTHMDLLGAFAIVGFAGDVPDIVYVELPDERQTTGDPGTVAKVPLRSRLSDPRRSRAESRGT